MDRSLYFLDEDDNDDPLAGIDVEGVAAGMILSYIWYCVRQPLCCRLGNFVIKEAENCVFGWRSWKGHEFRVRALIINEVFKEFSIFLTYS